MLPRNLRLAICGVWLLIVLGGLYLYLGRPDFVRDEILELSSTSVVAASVAYLVMGCLRGFTLIPVTYILPFGLLFLTPTVHFVLTMGGIIVSSASVYYFSEHLKLAEYFETRHAQQVDRLRALLRRRELPIVIGWSFFPLAPTDLICYACGSLEVGVWKLLAGVFIGEGIICAIYIFLGRQLLSLV